MQKLAAAVLSLILCSTGLCAQSAPQQPQTARQALMEMFFSKEPGTFAKHLPEATRATLEKSGALSILHQYSLLAAQLQAQGKSFQTFETGPVMLATEDPRTGQKVETVVERDSLRGDQDDIELSFQTYKDQQPQKTPFMPRMVFSMKRESGIWTLNEIAITIRLPLADPDLLKSISDGMKTRAAAASSSPQFPAQREGQSASSSFGSDTNALASVRTIVTAEITYAATYPDAGYTCTLSDLDGFGGGEPNEHQAMLISSGLASGKHQGYLFSLSGCGRTPALGFRLTATPIGDSYGRRTFCADQTGVVRSSDSADTCQSSGTPVR